MGAVRSSMPRYCRPRAFESFRRHVHDLSRPDALVRAATAVSMHALHDVDETSVLDALDALAEAARRGADPRSLRSRVAHLHLALFDEGGFRGNQADYYDPANSYLPRVLQTRRGIPITLALLYKAVAERLGLAVEGIGAPGHFLVRLQDEDGPLLVDPFHGGRVLADEDAYRLMEAALGTAVPRRASLLPPVTPGAWLARMLRNLESIHARRAQPRDAAAMHELRMLLGED
jgi:regulator of sirC expression with transglutaminase-like and TPR domain